MWELLLKLLESSMVMATPMSSSNQPRQRMHSFDRLHLMLCPTSSGMTLFPVGMLRIMALQSTVAKDGRM